MTENDVNIVKDEKLSDVTGGTSVSFVHYTVVKGDTMTNIARRFNTTTQEILKYNPMIKSPNLLRVGWVLLIPLP